MKIIKEFDTFINESKSPKEITKNTLSKLKELFQKLTKKDKNKSTDKSCDLPQYQFHYYLNNLTTSEKDKIRKIYNTNVQNLTYDKFIKSYAKYRVELSPSELQTLDERCNGFISVEEWEDAINKALNSLPKEKKEKCIETFNGYNPKSIKSFDNIPKEIKNMFDTIKGSSY